MIILGLFFEAYEGGIKKDPTTFSYYLVSSGLAFMALMIFSIICDYYKCYRSTSFLVMTGQNPMIAYVATGLFTGPVLNLLGIMPLFSVFSTSPWLGFLQGVILTSIAMFITMFFTRIKWFWRTWLNFFWLSKLYIKDLIIPMRSFIFTIPMFLCIFVIYLE